jgi:hypothetical protein
MRRLSLKSLLALSLACVGASALPSCATNDSMMYVIGVYARQQGACSPQPEANAPLLAKGTIDIAFAREYRAALLIGNQLTERGSREQLRTETSRVVLKGAEVRLETLTGESLHKPFSSTATGFVDPSSGTDPSIAVMYATLIPASVLDTLDEGTLIANVRVFGQTLGGQDVESSELAFPVEVCNGCLVAYPASARDLTADGGDYICKVATDAAGMATTQDTELPCNVGVDIQAPCTVCSGVSALCQNPKCNPAYTPGLVGCPTP